MEILNFILIVLILILIFFLVLLIFKLSELKKSDSNERLKFLVNESLLNFQNNIQQTINNARQAMESSKDFMSSNAIKTIENIKEVERVASELLTYQKETKKLGQSLQYLLQSPKLRGSYGEQVLEEILNDILPKGLWERQYPISKSGEKVDVVIKFKGIIIPIDSKFPKEDYEKYLNTENINEKKKYWDDYARVIKNKIRDIKSKYIIPGEGTTDFALMFIPSESIYYETISEKNFIGEKNDIYEYAQKNKVIQVSPNTIYIYLQFIIMGIREIEIIEHAKEIREKLINLEKNFNNFFSKFEEIGKNIEKASEAYRIGEGHIIRFKTKLDTTINFETEEKDNNSNL
jgi:DNA recombination protein RmuC